MAKTSSRLHHIVLYCVVCAISMKCCNFSKSKGQGNITGLKLSACHSRYLSFIQGRVSGIVVCVPRLCRMGYFLFSAGRDFAFHTPFSTASCGESTNWPHLPLTPEKRELDILEHAEEVDSPRLIVLALHSPFTAPPSCYIKGLTHFPTVIWNIGAHVLWRR